MADFISRDYTVENMENYPWDTGHDKNAAIHLVRELVPAADVVPWEWLERYADYFCAGVSMPEFVREAKMFYASTNEAMQGGVIDG